MKPDESHQAGAVALSESDGSSLWAVAHVRPRCEKKLAEAATRQGLEVHLPLQPRTRRYGARVRSFAHPLFPGYVFFRANPPGLRWIRQNRYVANLLEVADQQQLERQLLQVEAALSGGHVMEVLTYLETGRRVRVQAGPLRGLEGMVVRSKGQDRIVLNVDLIRGSVAMEVDSSLLVPV